MSVDLSGKRILITGANRGIGLGLAEGYLNAGADVTIAALEEDVTQVAAELGANHEKSVQGIACDIADLGQVDA